MEAVEIARKRSPSEQRRDNDCARSVVAVGLASGGRGPTRGWSRRSLRSRGSAAESLGELMGDPDPGKSKRVTDAMLKMQKIIVADL
jgi:hypothetical protein